MSHINHSQPNKDGHSLMRYHSFVDYCVVRLRVIYFLYLECKSNCTIHFKFHISNLTKTICLRCLWINYRLSVILRYLNFIVLELCPLIMHKIKKITGFPILSYVPCIYLDQLFWTMFRFIKYRSNVIFYFSLVSFHRYAPSAWIKWWFYWIPDIKLALNG